MRTITRLASLLLITLCAGCSATSLEGSWRNPAYSGGGSFRKVMVIVVSQDASMRRSTEDAFGAELAARGVQSVPSYTLLPQDTQVSNDQLTAAVQQSGADAVLAARLIDKSQQTSTYISSGPSMYPSYAGYYTSGWSPASTSSSYTYDVFTIETKFYQVSPETLVWTGTTKTSDPTDREREIKSFAHIITSALTKQSLLPPKPK